MCIDAPEKAIFRQFLVGSTVSLGNIVIHALVMTTVVRVIHIAAERHRLLPTSHMIVIMVATVSVLMAAHTCEVLVWSLAYAIIDAGPAGADPLYFAFANYTTLGYGDVIPVERGRLIGPITAMNGVLVFGWSTAVIFEVLRRTITHTSPAAAVE
jgi:hypothetical protein